MTKRIFLSILAVSLIVFICCMAVMLLVTYPYFNSSIAYEIKHEAQFLSAGVEMAGEDYIKSVDTERRITWIDGEGRVIFDNKKDAAQMENHLDREEIREALEGGSGESRRYSSTFTEKTVYYAVRLEGGTVLRLSATQLTVGAVFLTLLLPMVLVLLFVMALSAFLASSLSKKIVSPINNLDIESSDIVAPYSEISPLVTRVTRQNKLIELQMGDLKRRQKEFDAITENMAEGLLLLDKEGSVLAYNRAAPAFFEKSAALIRGNVFEYVKDEEFLRAVRSSLSGSSAEAEAEILGKTCQIIANPVKMDGEVNGAVLLILDITEKSRRDSMRREFTSNVSHELKTPLTSVYGISEMMMNGMVKSEDMVKFSESIHKETGRLITLINDIMRLSQLDEASLDMSKEELDLYDMAKSIAESLAPIAKGKDVTISVIGEECLICGIRSVVWEMIYNLCDNAIKYNRPGGKVEIRVSASDEDKIICVCDTGIGIPKEDCDRVFERFFRVDKSRSSSVGGTGLGLSIVKHGAAVHNARISLDSREGEGTRVTVTF